MCVYIYIYMYKYSNVSYIYDIAVRDTRDVNISGICSNGDIPGYTSVN